MASNSDQAACQSTSSKKKFVCQFGLRSYHKVRGDPVIEGVCAFFGRLLQCSSPVTLQVYEEVAAIRFGGWEPGSAPSKELLTLVSSRMKTLKSKGEIKESDNPEVPKLLLLKKDKYFEEADRVKTWYFLKRWRCDDRCDFCRNKRNAFPKYLDNFNVDIASPFLGVLEDMLGEHQRTTDDKSDVDDAVSKDNDDDDTGDDDLYTECFISNNSFSGNTDDDDDEFSDVSES
ncbi:uncharacterized protein LOC116289883 [Actinia tenebrosa]|uniref:Uncharacterized protein LOC116289883 n=1 Tax=Actinia tenebrosa TaxID=6105 RepID=A0A6P8HJ28_ACTTE|nr:uncharacterized protein LOC116289883 [Actinia tenebrosa]